MAEETEEIIFDINTEKATEALEALTTVAAEAGDEVGGLQDVLDDTPKAATNAAKATTDMTKANQQAMVAVKGLTPVVGNMNGALGAFGSIARASGEAGAGFADGLQKVQMGMALTQQIGALTTGLGGAKAAFAAFNAVVAANPIMTIVIAITALIAGIVALVSWWSSEESQLEQLNKTYEEHAEMLDRIERANKQELRMAELNGASKIELIKMEQKQTDAMYANAAIRKVNLQLQLAMMKADGKEEEDIDRVTEELEKQTKALEDLAKKRKDLADDLEYYQAVQDKANADAAVEAENKAAEAAKQRAAATSAAAAKQREEYAGLVSQLQKTEAAAAYNAKSDIEKLAALKEQQAALEGIKARRDELAQTSEGIRMLLEADKELTANLKEQEQINARVAEARAKEAELQSTLDATSANVEAELEMLRASEDEKLLIIQTRLEAEIAANEAILDDENSTVEERIAAAKRINDARIKYAQNAYAQEVRLDNQRIANENENAKKEQDQKKRTEAAKETIMKAGFDIAKSLAKDNAVAMKALSLGEVGINTAKGIMATIGTLGFPAAIPGIAAVAATGIAETVAILTQDVGDGGGGAAQMPTMPDVQQPTTEVHENMTQYEYEEKTKDQKVYVLVDDINDGQGRKADVVRENTY